MFTFEDKGGRSLTLRPEGTAPICRAYVEHGMQVLAQPVKLSYLGPFFRHVRPQAGRYRQFHQLGAEAIGTGSPLADAELIGLLAELLAELGVPGVELRLGSLVSLDTRQAYLEELKGHLRSHEAELAKEVRERIDANPLRAFDSDDEGTRAVMVAAPKLVERLEGEDAEHFAEVRALLDAAGVAYVIDPTLVRGLDYYTRTIFSFVCDRLGAQSEIGGGGRYDGLVEQLGGRPTPAVGWAAGIERILLALDEEEEAVGRDVFIAVAEEGHEQRAQAMVLVGELRKAGLSVELDLGGRGLKGQLKHADRIGARRAVILEAGGAQLRDMTSGDQRPVEAGNLIAEITGGGA
jgi:histidyl-tRNA synthetase